MNKSWGFKSRLAGVVAAIGLAATLTLGCDDDDPPTGGTDAGGFAGRTGVDAGRMTGAGGASSRGGTGGTTSAGGTGGTTSGGGTGGTSSGGGTGGTTAGGGAGGTTGM